MAEQYDNLMQICGFEPEEIEKQRPRIEATFERLGIVSEDYGPAEKRLQEQHAIELKGVRLVFRAWLLELLIWSLPKTRGKRFFIM